MKIDKYAMLERVAGGAHSGTEHVLIDGDVAVATNAHALAAVKIELEKEDVGGYLHPGHLKEARKTSDRNSYVCSAEIGEKAVVFADGRTAPRGEVEGPWPSWRAVIPGGRTRYQVAVDAKLLVDALFAIGALGTGRGHPENRMRHVAIRFTGDNTGQFTVANEMGFAVVMPVRAEPVFWKARRKLVEKVRRAWNRLLRKKKTKAEERRLREQSAEDVDGKETCDAA